MLASPYIRPVALLLVLLNVVNTIGEFILSHMLTVRAEALLAADPAFDKGARRGPDHGDAVLAVDQPNAVDRRRVLDQAGAEVTLNRHFRCELNLSQQTDTLPQTSRLNAIGVVVKGYY